MSSRPKRILSAHNPSQRPLSGHSAITFSRKELIQNVYNPQHTQTATTRANAKIMADIAAEGIERSKKIIVRQSRKQEEMEEEILRLKRTVNGLTEELARQRGKTESMRKKGQKFSKILSVQFQNQAHWTTNQLSSHLVTGIRHTYDMLKTKYDRLKEEHELLLKRGNVTRELEYLTYIEALERQNNQLKQRLEGIMAQEDLLGSGSAQVSVFVISQLKATRDRMVEKCKNIEGRYHMCLQTLKDRNKKVQFLQKLIIEKDNKTQAVYRQNKKLKDQLIQGQRKLQGSSKCSQSQVMEVNQGES